MAFKKLPTLTEALRQKRKKEKIDSIDISHTPKILNKIKKLTSSDSFASTEAKESRKIKLPSKKIAELAKKMINEKSSKKENNFDVKNQKKLSLDIKV